MDNIIYTSQYGQDKYLVETYFNHKEDGFFVDIGAGNGIFLSNTYVLSSTFKWKGICVEANNHTYEELVTNRTDAICDNRCILDDISEVKFMCVKNQTGWEHLLSFIDGYIPWNNEVYDSYTKKTVALNTLLNEHNAPAEIDYISMDIEGSELAVLTEFFKTNTRKVKLWTIEHSNEQEVIDLMLANGYKLVTKLKADNIFELI